MLIELEQDIYQNRFIYRLSRSNLRNVYSSNLDSLRAYALRKGYVASKGHVIAHQETSEYLPLVKEASLPGGALQPGSNLWYKVATKSTGRAIYRATPEGSVQVFSQNAGWGISWHTGNVLTSAKYLPELEYREVSIEFLISGEASLPSEEYYHSLIRTLV